MLRVDYIRVFPSTLLPLWSAFFVISFFSLFYFVFDARFLFFLVDVDLEENISAKSFQTYSFNRRERFSSAMTKHLCWTVGRRVSCDDVDKVLVTGWVQPHQINQVWPGRACSLADLALHDLLVVLGLEKVGVSVSEAPLWVRRSVGLYAAGRDYWRG